MAKEKTGIVLFETKDKSVSFPVEVTDETEWLNRNQLKKDLRCQNGVSSPFYWTAPMRK